VALAGTDGARLELRGEKKPGSALDFASPQAQAAPWCMPNPAGELIADGADVGDTNGDREFVCAFKAARSAALELRLRNDVENCISVLRRCWLRLPMPDLSTVVFVTAAMTFGGRIKGID